MAAPAAAAQRIAIRRQGQPRPETSTMAAMAELAPPAQAAASAASADQAEMRPLARVAAVEAAVVARPSINIPAERDRPIISLAGPPGTVPAAVEELAELVCIPSMAARAAPMAAAEAAPAIMDQEALAAMAVKESP
jgi:hypothetical protein